MFSNSKCWNSHLTMDWVFGRHKTNRGTNVAANVVFVSLVTVWLCFNENLINDEAKCEENAIFSGNQIYIFSVVNWVIMGSLHFLYWSYSKQIIAFLAVFAVEKAALCICISVVWLNAFNHLNRNKYRQKTKNGCPLKGLFIVFGLLYIYANMFSLRSSSNGKNCLTL